MKVFVSGENLKRLCFAHYAAHYFGISKMNLALGLEVFEDDRYIRFPIWMDYMFPPECSEAEILLYGGVQCSRWIERMLKKERKD